MIQENDQICIENLKYQYHHILAVDKDGIDMSLFEQEKPIYTLYGSNSGVIYTYPEWDTAVIVFSSEREDYEDNPTRNGWPWTTSLTGWSLEDYTDAYYNASVFLESRITETELAQLRHWFIEGWVKENTID